MNRTGGEIDVLIIGVMMFTLFIFFIASLVLAVYLIVRRSRKRNIQSVGGQSAPSINVRDRNPPHYVAQNKPVRSIDGVIGKKPKSNYRYVAKKYIMTSSEREFYKRLFSILGREYLIFPQIHLSTIFAHDIYRQSFQGALSAIQRKSVDYVLCDTNFHIACAIELDDRSHNRPDRRERDDFVDGIFNDTRTPLVRVSTYSNISDGELYSSIKDCISGELPCVVRLV